MNDIIPLFRGVLLLDLKTYEAFIDRKDAMKRGILILLACFLVAGSIVFVMDLLDNLRPFDETAAAQMQADFEQGINTFLQFSPQSDEFTQLFIDQFLENFRVGLQIAQDIDALPTRLPRPVGGFFEALGAWVTGAFAHLGAWLTYAIWVLLFARLLGGRSGIGRFLGLTALFAVPNLLGIFRPIPCAGFILTTIGVVWGWLVYLRAVQVSQDFSAGKAILATLLPAILLLAIIGIVSLIGVLAIVSASGS